MTFADMIHAVSHPIPVPMTTAQKALKKLRRREEYYDAREYYRIAPEIHTLGLMHALSISEPAARRLLIYSEMAGIIEYVRTDDHLKIYRRAK